MSKNGYRHHRSTEDLKLSANSGCEGCVTIYSLKDRTGIYHEDIPENRSELPQKQIICTALTDGKCPETIWGLRFWQPNLEKSQALMKLVFCFTEPGEWKNKMHIRLANKVHSRGRTVRDCYFTSCRRNLEFRKSLCNSSALAPILCWESPSMLSNFNPCTYTPCICRLFYYRAIYCAFNGESGAMGSFESLLGLI